MSHLYPRALRGRPATGLLLLRVLVTAAVVFRRPTSHLLESGAALLLLMGVWTRAAAAFIVLAELWHLGFRSHPWVSALLATMTLPLPLIGPGAWSADARLFGWRRIEIPPTQKGLDNTPSSDGDAPKSNGNARCS